MKVSVIVPCFNVEKYIEACIISVFEQTYDDIEIIVVNDGSKDDTEAIIKKLEPKSPIPFTYIYQKNGGAPKARNHGLDHANGDYIQFLDADDVLKPEKLAHQIELIKQNHFPSIIIGSYSRQSESGKVLKEKIYPEKPSELIWVKLMESDLGITSANLFRRKILVENGIRWNEKLKSSQEYYLMFEVMKISPNLVFDPDIQTIVYHRDFGSISQLTESENLLRFLDVRVEMIEYVKTILNKNDLQDCYQALFHTLRAVYPEFPEKATQYFKKYIPTTFRPTISSTVTRYYLMLFNLIGFENAEKLRVGAKKVLQKM